MSWRRYTSWAVQQTTRGNSYSLHVQSSYVSKFAHVTSCSSPTLQALNIPLGTYVFARPLLVCLTYVTSRMSPPGTQTSLFGMITIPLIYFPYALIALDFLMAGPSAAAASVTGAVAGHLWWWGVYHSRALADYSRAPRWLRRLVGQPPQGSASGGTGGVHVVPPRERAEAAGSSSGHSWGSGQRLGQQ